MKKAFYCALITAAIGFAVAVWVSTASPQSAPRWMLNNDTCSLHPVPARYLLGVISMTDPDPESIWLFFSLPP